MSDITKIPEPYPCGRSFVLSPYTIRCSEIDDAAELAPSAEWFAAMAKPSDPISETDLKRIAPPKKKYLEEGGCPMFGGSFYGGIMCRAVGSPLHSYVGVKFCEGGRQIYCPIYREKQAILSPPQALS